ncbi:MAG: hypothetical protein ACR2JV_09185 [Gaiellales bacterium]
MDDQLRTLLPAYAAGSLDPEWHAHVERALQQSPALLAEAMELMLVHEHLLEVRSGLEAQPVDVEG